MALTMVFQIPGMTRKQYDQVVKGLEAAGAGNPDGRQFHVASPKPDGWFVLDIWENEKKFEKFGQTLMPLLQKAGVNAPKPDVYPTHNIIKGK